MRQKRAEMGVGTLIIFIAMLLVAAIAAGVLIQTAGALQEKALTTGSQARQQISTNLRVVEVSGSDGLDSNLNLFSMNIKLAPGSDPIKLDETIITFNTKNTTTSLIYLAENTHANISYCDLNFTNGSNGSWVVNGTVSQCANTSVADENGTYTVEYLQKGSNYVANKVQRGDVIKLYLLSPRDISEDETVRINVVPKSGSPTLVQFATPDVVATQRVYLYP